MKFDKCKDFKTNSGFTARIIAYTGDLGSEIYYPYLGYIRFKDGNIGFYHWSAEGEVLGNYKPFNLTEAIDPDFAKSNLYDEFQKFWEELSPADMQSFTEGELLDLFVVKEKNLEDLQNSELKGAIAALRKSSHKHAIALRKKLQDRLDFTIDETIKIFEGLNQ